VQDIAEVLAASLPTGAGRPTNGRSLPMLQ
jgi:hypothetical protein